MNNFLKKPNTPLIICVATILILVAAFIVVFIIFSQGRASLATQQQWSSGKESFDDAYEIAAADKETPDKSLYVPNLVNQIGKTVDEAIKNIGHGATVVSQTPTETKLNLTNDTQSDKAGTPTVVMTTDANGKITQISFTCNTWYLGYGALSFVDLVDNEHCIEKTLNEAGLHLDYGSVVAPTNRASYTTYAADGTTVAKESCSFTGKGWSATLTYDYTLANTKSNLADTVRTLTITIS